jgi:hypothetical protein
MNRRLTMKRNWNYKVSSVYLNEQHTCYYLTCASIRGARVLPIFSLELARNYPIIPRTFATHFSCANICGRKFLSVGRRFSTLLHNLGALPSYLTSYIISQVDIYVVLPQYVNIYDTLWPMSSNEDEKCGAYGCQLHKRGGSGTYTCMKWICYDYEYELDTKSSTYLNMSQTDRITYNYNWSNYTCLHSQSQSKYQCGVVSIWLSAAVEGVKTTYICMKWICYEYEGYGWWGVSTIM